MIFRHPHLLAILPLTCLPLLGEAPKPAEKPGHSIHGESFDEGPRRFAKLIGGTGDVNFPVTTKSPEAQQFFNQGVGQLHGFWYYEAERSFRQVLHLDPDCMMAYWGMAMANVENETRARSLISKAVAKLDQAKEKEKLWIRSVEKYFAESKNDDERKAKGKQLVKDWEAIAMLDPQDLEAKAFIVYQTWWNSSRRGIEVGSPLSTHALAEQVLAKKPLHPVHHYLIHLWDKEGPKQGIDAAARCGPGAPSIAHMWHMPGHIYADLERWEDSAWSQEAAIRVDHLRMMERGTMPDQIHNYAHNSEWFIRNLNHLGRVKEALAVAQNMMEEPRIPRSAKVLDNPNQKWDASGSAYTLGKQRLIETLLRWELWDQVIALSHTPYLEPGRDFDDQLKREHLIALAHFSKGQVEAGRSARQRLIDRLADYKKDRATALDRAETEARGKDQKAEEINKAITSAIEPFTQKITTALQLLDELEVHQALAEGKLEEAKNLRGKLRKIPEDRLARLDLKLGRNDEALKSAEQFAEKNRKQTQPLALLAEIQWAVGKKEAAQKSLTDLRKIAGGSDAHLPVLERLNPLYAEAGIAEPWRIPTPPATDVGNRPALDTLGPLFWSPNAAPAWQLVNHEQQTVSSSQYAGKPHLLIFFLGKGCLHCVRQLQSFAPKADAFAKIGVPIVAVSTDSAAGVAETLPLGKDQGGFSFPILSDEQHTAFRAFEAFDDFENKPLHGTYLIDAQGKIRWQHISYEPFMLPEFLLEEAERLLNLPPMDKSGVAQLPTR
jgi:peroxiredoxin/tetratricopeptide (TPR) repeat protein